jgi:hypothetical protein
VGLFSRDVQRASPDRDWPDGLLERIALMVIEQRFPSGGPPGAARGAYELAPVEGAVRGYREASAAAPLVIRGVDTTARLRGLGEVTIWLEAGAVRYRLALGPLRRANGRMFGVIFGVLVVLFLLGLFASDVDCPWLAAVILIAAYGAMTGLIFGITMTAQTRDACDALDRTLARAAEDVERDQQKPATG